MVHIHKGDPDAHTHTRPRMRGSTYSTQERGDPLYWDLSACVYSIGSNKQINPDKVGPPSPGPNRWNPASLFHIHKGDPEVTGSGRWFTFTKGTRR